jgi:hypothetical protein
VNHLLRVDNACNRSYPDLADGKYTFGVYGTSSAGMAGRPAVVDFTVDTTAPTTQLSFTPACAPPPDINSISEFVTSMLVLAHRK